LSFRVYKNSQQDSAELGTEEQVDNHLTSEQLPEKWQGSEHQLLTLTFFWRQHILS